MNIRKLRKGRHHIPRLGLPALLREFGDSRRLVAFDLGFEIMRGNIGEANSRHLLAFRHASSLSCFCPRQRAVGTVSPFTVPCTLPRLNLLQQLAGPSDGSCPDADRPLFQFVVVCHLGVGCECCRYSARSGQRETRQDKCYTITLGCVKLAGSKQKLLRDLHVSEDKDFSATKAICSEFEIQIIKANEYPGPNQTRAVASIDRIRRKHGDGHLRIVLSTILEAGPQGAIIDEYTVWSVSDLVEACSDWIEQDLSSWYEAWDNLPVGQVMWVLRDLRSAGRMRAVRFGALYLLLSNFRQGMPLNDVVRNSTDKKIFSMLNISTSSFTRQRELSETLGRTIAAASKRMDAEEFALWVQDECGLTIAEAKRFVKLAAKAAAPSPAQAIAA